jgi:hypothetical protein
MNPKRIKKDKHIFDYLPNELLWEIALFLKLEEIYYFMLNYKRMFLITQNDNFWRDVYNINTKYHNFLTKKTWKETLKYGKEICTQIAKESESLRKIINEYMPSNASVHEFFDDRYKPCKLNNLDQLGSIE